MEPETARETAPTPQRRRGPSTIDSVLRRIAALVRTSHPEAVAVRYRYRDIDGDDGGWLVPVEVLDDGEVLGGYMPWWESEEAWQPVAASWPRVEKLLTQLDTRGALPDRGDVAELDQVVVLPSPPPDPAVAAAVKLIRRARRKGWKVDVARPRGDVELTLMLPDPSLVTEVVRLLNELAD